MVGEEHMEGVRACIFNMHDGIPRNRSPTIRFMSEANSWATIKVYYYLFVRCFVTSA